MSSPFTPVGSGATYDPFELPIVNEIVNAYSERRQAVWASAVADRVTDDDVHTRAFWQGIQAWIEGNCTSYVDHTQAVSGNFEGQASVPMFSLAAFRAAAGLNAAGFRRATTWIPHPVTPDWETDVTFSYGQVALSDIVGPWGFVGFQNALSTLQWTRYKIDDLNAVGSEYENTDITIYQEASCVTALAAAIAGWSPTWLPGITSFRYYARADLTETAPTWISRGLRARSRGLIEVPTVRPCAVGMHYPIDFNEDLDALGVAANTLKFHEEWPERTPPVSPRGGAAEPTATWFGTYTDNPVVLAALACVSKTGTYFAWSLGQSSVLKWNFTHSN